MNETKGCLNCRFLVLNMPTDGHPHKCKHSWPYGVNEDLNGCTDKIELPKFVKIFKRKLNA